MKSDYDAREPKILMPPVVYYEECGSTFDEAWKLVAAGRLPEWGAALAGRQTAGRGQMRRAWHSPEGNLYVSFRLPSAPLFDDEAAAVLTAFFCLGVLRDLGIPALLKWPNDLVLPLNDPPAASAGFAYGKLGGILLEERDKVVIAGLGLNCRAVPGMELLREGAALPATALPAPWRDKSASDLWGTLVSGMIVRYRSVLEEANSYGHERIRHKIMNEINDLLLWRGQSVRVSGACDFAGNCFDGEGAGVLEGVVVGLSPRGGLEILENAPFGGAAGVGAGSAAVAARRRELCSGAIVLAC